MALPEGVPRVTVTTGEPIITPGGGLAQGVLRFTGPDLVTVGSLELLLGGGEPAYLTGGVGTIDLVPNDLAGMDPAGWTYRVDAEFAGGMPGWTRYISVPSGDDPIQLADVLVPDPVAGEFTVLIDPSSLGGAAFLDVGQAAGTVAAGDDPRFDGIGGGGAPTGPAGGVLTGTYPDPGLAAGTIASFDPAGAASAAQSAAATDATSKAAGAQSTAISTAATDATAKVSAHSGASDPHGDRAAAATDATTKAGAAQSAAITAAATDATGKVTAHTGATDPHGDRSAAATALSGHVVATDPHGDRAAAATDATTKANSAQSAATSAAATDATSKVTTHTGAVDPHADRAFATSAVSAHAGASDPHGDRAFATGAVTTHTGASDPHGDRAAASTDAASKITTHSGAADPHGDRAFTTTSVTTHAGATDPHGDRAFTTAAISTHAGAADPHGDRADAATKYVPLAGGAVSGSLTVSGHALRTPQAADHGLRAWSFDPRFCGATASVAVAGTLFLSGLFVTESFTATALYWGVAVAPTGQTAAQNFVGLYDSGGNLLTSVGVDADTSTTGLKTATINVPLTPGTYWAAFLFNASTTAPQLPRCAGAGGSPSLINVGLSGAAQLYASNGTGRTSLPSTITMASNVAATGYWAGIK